MFERFTEQARRTLFYARAEASRFGVPSIETEHLLLGLIREGKGVASRILATLNHGVEEVCNEIECRAEPREDVPTSVEIPFSAEIKRIFQHAAEEADRLLHNYIGAEHLLLGIFREQQSVAGTILTERGMRLESVRGLVAMLKNPFSVDVEIEQLDRGRHAGDD